MPHCDLWLSEPWLEVNLPEPLPSFEGVLSLESAIPDPTGRRYRNRRFARMRQLAPDRWEYREAPVSRET
jgi:hypothetical protein